MTLSRRSFFSSLAVALAAPAIVRVESLMRLAPTEIIRPDISLRLISTYNPLEMPVTRLDVLYSSFQVPPEWQLDAFAERILAPMIQKLEKQVADAVIYSSGALHYDGNRIKSIGLADLLIEARSTPSIE